MDYNVIHGFRLSNFFHKKIVTQVIAALGSFAVAIFLIIGMQWWGEGFVVRADDICDFGYGWNGSACATCLSSEHTEGNVCVPNTDSCSIPNGSGVHTWVPSASWSKVGGDGLGWADNTYELVRDITEFNSQLYAGLSDSTGDGEAWRYNGGTSWTRVGGDGFGWANNTYEQARTFAVFNNQLYVGLGASPGDAEVWRYNGGTSWSKAGGDWLSGSWGGTGSTDPEQVKPLWVFEGKLYAGLGSSPGSAEVWVWNGSIWSKVGGDGLGWADNTYENIWSAVTYNNQMYVGLGSKFNEDVGDAEVWRYNGGTSWTRIGGDGFGWANNAYSRVASMAVYSGSLYAGLGSMPGTAEVWRYEGGTSWTKVGGSGLGWPGSMYENVTSLAAFGGKLFAGLGTSAGDAEVWEWDGVGWTKRGGDGLGWADNTYEIVHSLQGFGNALYAGLASGTGDAEVWAWSGPAAGGAWGSCTTPYTCSSGYELQEDACIVREVPPALTSCFGVADATCSLAANPSRIQKNASTTVSWYVSPLNANTSCSIAATPGTPGLPLSWDHAGGSWSGSAEVSLGLQTTFTLTCTTSEGVPASISKTVGLFPTLQEQ